MKRASLLSQEWCPVVERLGGAQAIEAGARATKAFQRARGVPDAARLLRLVLAYRRGQGGGQGGLRSTASWASAVGLADISNAAWLHRLRGCGDWLAAAAPAASKAPTSAAV
jgi:hypothetical protein